MKIKNSVKSTFIVSVLCVGIAIYSSCQKSNTKPTVVSENITTTNQPSVNQLSRTSNNYDGETIFRGIFFIKGNFKNEIVSYKGVDIYSALTPVQLSIVDKLHDKIINQMKVIDANCFNVFATEIKSGSASRVDAALDKTATLFFKAMSMMPEYAEIAKLNRDESLVSKSSSVYNDVSTNSLLATNPDLLCNNSLCSSVDKQATAVFAVVVVAIFAGAVHNTVAVTANAVAAVNVAAAVYLAVWKYKYWWSDARLMTPASEYPANYRDLYSLKYESFVNDIARVYQ